MYPNLGAFSNQRSESIHPVTKQILHKHLSLAEASRRFRETVRSSFKALIAEEAASGSKLPRTLDQKAFTLLADTISLYAINKISAEWEITKQGISDGSLQPTTSSCSICELFIRFGLPCRHYLAAPCSDGAPIPRSLIHPRWWVNSKPIRITNWTPLYRIFALPLSPPRLLPAPLSSLYRNDLTRLDLQMLEAREGLQGYARHRFDTVAAQAQQTLVNFAEELQEDDLHTRMPEMVKTSGWNRRKKSHGRANQRLLTGTEAAERDANRRENQQAQRDALQALPYAYDFEEEDIIYVEAEAEAVEDPFQPPLSTAPPQLPPQAQATYSRAGRKRTATMKALEEEDTPKRATGRARGRGE